MTFVVSDNPHTPALVTLLPAGPRVPTRLDAAAGCMAHPSETPTPGWPCP